MTSSNVKDEIRKVHRYLVTSYYCGGQLSAAFSALHKDTDLNFLPWVGTAMMLDVPEAAPAASVAKAATSMPATNIDGLVCLVYK